MSLPEYYIYNPWFMGQKPIALPLAPEFSFKEEAAIPATPAGPITPVPVPQLAEGQTKAAPLHIQKISNRHLDVPPNSRLRLKIESNTVGINCTWIKNDQTLCEGKQCEFSTEGWRYGAHKVIAFCHNGVSSVRIPYLVRIGYAYTNNSHDFLEPSMVPVDKQPSLLLFDQSYMRLAGGIAWAHRSKDEVIVLDSVSQPLNWQELIVTDVGGVALLGIGSRHQHIIMPGSRMRTLRMENNLETIEIVRGKIRSRNVDAAASEWRMIYGKWLTITPGVDADFTAETSAKDHRKLDITVARGTITLRIAHQDTTTVKAVPKTNTTVDASYRSKLLKLQGIYQNSAAQEEIIHLLPGMHIIARSTDLSNINNITIADYNNSALVFEKTTPEYFEVGNILENSPEPGDTLVDNDTADFFHERYGFITKTPGDFVDSNQVIAAAESALGKRDYVRALEVIITYFSTHKEKNGQLYLLAGRAYHGLKKYSYAYRLYQKAIANEAPESELYYSHGLLCLEMQRYHEAIDAFGKLASSSEQSRQVASYYKGLAHFLLKNNFRASVNMKDAIWLGGDPTISTAAQEIVDFLHDKSPASAHLRQEIFYDSNVFRLAKGAAPPAADPYRSARASLTAFDWQRDIFNQQNSRITAIAQGGLLYYDQQHLLREELQLGLNLDFNMQKFTNMASSHLEVTPFVKTIRSQGGGVDGFGLEIKGGSKEGWQPEISFSSAIYFDTAQRQPLYLDPFTEEYNTLDMVSGRLYELNVALTPYTTSKATWLVQPHITRFIHRISDYSNFDYEEPALDSLFSYQFTPWWDSKLRANLRSRSSSAHTDTIYEAWLTLGRRINSSFHAEAFYATINDNSSTHDYSYDVTKAGLALDVSL